MVLLEAFLDLLLVGSGLLIRYGQASDGRVNFG